MAMMRLASFIKVLGRFDFSLTLLSESGFHYEDDDNAVCSKCRNKLPLKSVTSQSDLSKQEFHNIGCGFVLLKKGGSSNYQRISSTINLDQLPHTVSKDESKSLEQEPTVTDQSGPVVEQKSTITVQSGPIVEEEPTVSIQSGPIIEQESTIAVQSGPIVEQQENTLTIDLSKDAITGNSSESDTSEDMHANRKGLVQRILCRRRESQSKPTRQQKGSSQGASKDPHSGEANDQTSKHQPKVKVCNGNTVSLDGRASASEYSDFSTRFMTFINSPYKNIDANLAAAGFYYSGIDGRIYCYHCAIGFIDWKPEYDIRMEHTRYRPSCPVTRRQELVMHQGQPHQKETEPHGCSHQKEAEPHERSQQMETENHGRPHQKETEPHGRSQQREVEPHGRSQQREVEPHGHCHQKEVEPHGRSQQREVEPHGRSQQREVEPYKRCHQKEAEPHGRSQQRKVEPHGRPHQKEAEPHGHCHQKEVEPHGRSNQKEALNHGHPQQKQAAYQGNPNQKEAVSHGQTHQKEAVSHGHPHQKEAVPHGHPHKTEAVPHGHTHKKEAEPHRRSQKKEAEPHRRSQKKEAEPHRRSHKKEAVSHGHPHQKEAEPHGRPHKKDSTPHGQISLHDADNTYVSTEGSRSPQQHRSLHAAAQNIQSVESNITLSPEEAREESRRVASFQASECPHHLKRIAVYLAQNGFYWTGKQSILRCHGCNIGLYVDPSDDVVSNHRNLQASCPLLQLPFCTDQADNPENEGFWSKFLSRFTRKH